MEKPEGPIDELKLTKTELRRMHDEIDYYDRQETLERIYEIASDVKIEGDPRVWLKKLEDIRGAASEFIW